MICRLVLYVIGISCTCCSSKISGDNVALRNEIRSYKLENVDTLVDIGCGNGNHDREIARYYPHLYFVLEDLPFDRQGHNMQKVITNRLKNTPSIPAIQQHYRFVAGSEDTIPLPSASYKRVLCRRTLHEFSNRPKMVSELVRILSGDGVLTVIEGIPEQPGEIDPYCKKPHLTKEEVISSFPSLTVLNDTVLAYRNRKLSMVNFVKKSN